MTQWDNLKHLELELENVRDADGLTEGVIVGTSVGASNGDNDGGSVGGGTSASIGIGVGFADGSLSVDIVGGPVVTLGFLVGTRVGRAWGVPMIGVLPLGGGVAVPLLNPVVGA